MSGPHHPSGTRPPIDPEASALIAFCRTGKPLRVAAGVNLFREGSTCEQVLLVEEGEVELTVSSGEKQMRLGMAGVLGLLGLSAAISSVPHETTATAHTACRLVAVSASDMRDYLKQHPDSCLKAVQSLGADILDLSTNTIRPLRLRPRYPKI